MRLVSLDLVKRYGCNLPMRLARPILDEKGMVLVGKDVELTPFIVNRLLSLGIYSVYVNDGLTDDIVIPEPISQETMMRAISFVYNTMTELRNSKKLSSYFQSPKFTKEIRKLFNTILEELKQNSSALLHLANIYSTDSFLYHHSFNVTIMALMVGLKLKLDERQLIELGIGTLLHDIGKLAIPDAIINKPGKLTKEEFEIVKTHTTQGYEMLKRQGDISALAAQIALLHHERYDGTGYPRGIPGKEQHLFGRIVSVCDVYEALTANRVYRKGHLPHQAFEYILGGGGTHFDPDIVNTFVKTIAVYPIGSEVTLSTGERAVVTEVNVYCPHRPKLRVLFDANGNPLENPYDLHLHKELTCMIVDSNHEGISESHVSAFVR
jgi:HD-GYP domain-containing protein (c-di-GMP phosphodiesterase class II)